MSEREPVTEASNPRTAAIDGCDTLGVLRLLNAEDATVSDVVRAALPQLALAVEATVDGMRQGGRLIYVGAGTSGRLGVLDAAECPPTFGVPPGQVIALIAGGPEALTRGVEGAEDDREAGRRDLLALEPGPHDVIVGLAASGRTPYVLAAMQAAREAGARTVGIACNAPSPLLEATDMAIPLVVGPEAIAGSTRLKAGTATKMALNLLSTASMVRLGKVYGNLMVDVRVANDKLAERAVRIVCQVAGTMPVQARRLLRATGWKVKPAIVMAVLGVPLEEAERRLAEAGGLLSQVIGAARDRQETQAR
ncbi:MAG: N-acetylmuramic acid 6-phosphate etherase [Anaerolineae bacterium]